ncbi:MAG: hypothetical protein JXR76_06475 [Deltaproteobacteria bacterium]|nr:hypothetical protein [Deltaproteobacteria bacterium]
MTITVKFYDKAGELVQNEMVSRWERFLAGDWQNEMPGSSGWFLVINRVRRICGLVEITQKGGYSHLVQPQRMYIPVENRWKGWYWGVPFPNPMSLTFPFVKAVECTPLSAKKNHLMSSIPSPVAPNASQQDKTLSDSTLINSASVSILPEPLHEIPGRVEMEWSRFLCGHWTRAHPSHSGIWITADNNGQINGQLFTFKVENVQETVFRQSALHPFEPAKDCWRWSASVPFYFPKQIVSGTPKSLNPAREREALSRRASLRVISDE